MATSQRPAGRFIWLSLVVLLAIIAYAVFRPGKPRPQTQDSLITEPLYSGPKKEVIPNPVQTKTLADSTVVWILDKDATIQPAAGYPRQREAKVDGDMYIEVNKDSGPLVLKSRLLVMTVMSKASFRVIAWAKEAGEEVQVLSGTLKVAPNYKSQFNAPDTLKANQMVMINKDIDMMEKEKFDAAALGAWSKKLVRP
ncbi:FecR family protein [Filimonas effusa]|uniref:Uncharacterized protein n=1 Tax=Filimonas effusa TaxID=2508721 RepID=A0A4Q1D196_9BACT|nr:hypothetical protein [Filimonas effusa]RXK80749.1 hypothetical protein ESB13_21530 [Filimonas effusa]